MGLRQPVHAEDVAMACVRAVQAPHVCRHAYNLQAGKHGVPGHGEPVFSALNRRPRFSRCRFGYSDCRAAAALPSALS